jgi:hypothetical protein
MDYRDLERAARDQGFRLILSRKGHRIFYPRDPAQRPIVFSGTPGDQRAIRNFLAAMRRAGLVWPRKE